MALLNCHGARFRIEMMLFRRGDGPDGMPDDIIPGKDARKSGFCSPSRSIRENPFRPSPTRRISLIVIFVFVVVEEEGPRSSDGSDDDPNPGHLAAREGLCGGIVEGITRVNLACLQDGARVWVSQCPPTRKWHWGWPGLPLGLLVLYVCAGPG